MTWDTCLPCGLNLLVILAEDIELIACWHRGGLAV